MLFTDLASYAGCLGAVGETSWRLSGTELVQTELVRTELVRTKLFAKLLAELEAWVEIR